MTKTKAALVMTVATTVATSGCPARCAASGAQEQWLLGTIDDGTVIEVRAFEVLSEGINAGTEFGGNDPGALKTTGDFGADRLELVIEQGEHTIEIALFDVDEVGVWAVGADAEARITVDGATATSGTLTTGADGENGGRTFVIDAAIDDAPLAGAPRAVCVRQRQRLRLTFRTPRTVDVLARHCPEALLHDDAAAFEWSL